VLTALLLAAAVSGGGLRLEVGPWTGTSLPAASRSAVSFRLTITGRPKSTVTLVASAVAGGWLAAFCTSSVCSPERVDVTLPSSGRAVYQFELIRQIPNAPKRSGARIGSTDGAVTLDIAPVSPGNP
jgi:hypothetical protein